MRNAISLRNKFEARNPKLETDSMTENGNLKHYELEDRTLVFARKVRFFVKKLPKTTANIEDGKQLIRASGSVGSNYIEANESLGKKDFLMRIKICRKEAKESRYWLKLVDVDSKTDLEEERKELEKEATELTNIFGSIFRKSE